PYADWAEPERTRLRTRYTAAAVRAGELLLAAGAPANARRAAERAITADTIAENAYQLLARTTWPRRTSAAPVRRSTPAEPRLPPSTWPRAAPPWRS
ncbi:MAG: hypothetical protein M3408_10985, partial [Actinomycetota bacterium]|nr:hypothetical protein [Actinomycetota bacterium]